MTSSSVLVVGSIALDTVETRAGKQSDILGGAATFISLAASRFCPVNLVAVVGENDFPSAHTDLLTQAGIDLQGLERAAGKTFRWSGIYTEDFSSRTTLDTQLGVFESFQPKIPAAYRQSQFLMLGNIHPQLQLEVLKAVGSDMYVVADTMNLWIDTSAKTLLEVIEQVDLLVINDEEAYMLTDEHQITVAARKLLAMGPKSLIIKRGEHGAFLFTEQCRFLAPALPLDEVVDPTGAGDTFAGGLIGYLAAQQSTDINTLKKGMLYGSALAAIAVSAFGAQPLADVTQGLIDERYGQLRQLVSID